MRILLMMSLALAFASCNSTKEFIADESSEASENGRNISDRAPYYTENEIKRLDGIPKFFDDAAVDTADRSRKLSNRWSSFYDEEMYKFRNYLRDN